MISTSKSLLLSEVCEQKYFPQNMRIRTEKTRIQYRSMIKLFGRFLRRPARLDDLTDELACGFANWLQDGRSAATVNGNLVYLKAIWNFLAKKKIVSMFPTFAKIPEDDQVPTAWTMAEIEKLLKACRETPGEMFGVPACLFWLSLHFFWWDTGERTGASMCLRWELLDFETGVVEIPAKYRKTNRAMTYELKPETLALLHQIHTARGKPAEGLIFVFDAHFATFYNHYTRLLKRAGLPSGSKCKPQKMRRSFASHLEKAGGDATAALGHSTRRVTEESYIDPRIATKPPANIVMPDFGEESKGGEK